MQADLFEPKSQHGTKAENRKARKAQKEARQLARDPKPVKPRNCSQRLYLEAMETSAQVFGIGPAGVGKTYLAARRSARLLDEGKIAKIYLVRATIEPERHKIGFLPGGQDSKTRPWTIPLIEAMKEEVGGKQVERFQSDNSIEFVPFAFMRGRTFKDAVVIIDEAQNLNLADFKLLMTRIGENCQYLINGDPSQTDISDSGLNTVLRMVDTMRIDAEIVEFSSDDVERSHYAGQWVRAFEKKEAS